MKFNKLLILCLSVLAYSPHLVNAQKTTASSVVSAVNSSVNSSSGLIYSIDEGQSVVNLRLAHSLLGRFDTKGNGLSGEIVVNGNQASSDLIEFKVDNFKSIISLRDSHIKKTYLEMAKYPFITLSGLKITWAAEPSVAQIEQASEVPFSADLSVKGKKVAIAGTAKVLSAPPAFKVSATFPLKISSFEIPTPHYMGVGVEDDFVVQVELVASPELSTGDLSFDQPSAAPNEKVAPELKPEVKPEVKPEMKPAPDKKSRKKSKSKE